MKSPVPSQRPRRRQNPSLARFAEGLLSAATPWLLLTSSCPTSFAAEGIPHPLATPASYELHPDLELTLFACEPDVVDPVSLTFDEFGRAYVVEMRDYPYGFGPDRKPGGTVRLLEDSNGDGKADRSSVFAEGLSYPTSILAWDGGVLVMAPPEVVFLKDTDHDGRADHREVVVRGIQLGVTDSNANGLRWAFDNWIHAVNGGNGGLASLPKFGNAPIELGDRDFRFQPSSGRLERTAHTGGGFGLVFDEWGHSYTPHNVNHLQQRVTDADSFSQYPGLPAFETTHSISDHGDMARIYAISTAVTRPNHPEQAGYFSSSGSMGYLGHRGWPGDLPGSVFVCDVVGNLVHRDILSPDGPIQKASRPTAEQTREFFASRDNHFRPTGVELGPDGALYLLDMQRDVIEHPDYIPKKLLETLDLRAGQDRGRIYRIAPKGWPTVRELPGKGSPKELVAQLASSNQWTRLTAQRLLVTRQDKSVVADLERLAVGPDALGRLHALWTLSGLDALPKTLLRRALRDPHPGLRASAIQLAPERFPASRSMQKAVVSLFADSSMTVRFSALLAVGQFSIRPMGLPTPSVRTVLWNDRSSRWMRRAALAALPVGEERWAMSEWLMSPHVRKASDTDAVDAIRELADLVGARSSTLSGTALAHHLHQALVLERPGILLPIRVAFLEGLASGLNRAGVRPVLPEEGVAALRTAMDLTQPSLLAAAWRLARIFQIPDTDAQIKALTTAARVVSDPTHSISQRSEALQVLQLASITEAAPVLFGLLEGREPLTLQQAALELLRHHREPVVGEGLIRAWSGLSPSLRAPVVNLLVYRPTFHNALLTALESGALQAGELNLDLEHRRQLLRKAAPDIRTRAAHFMSDEEYSNRKTAVDDWLGKLPPNGDGSRGRPLFERICAQCHRVGSLGSQVGPDLTGVRHRSVEDLLSNILDPNMALNPAYVAFTAERKDGENETGILVAENADSVTLIQAGERRVSLPRAQLARLKSDGKSLMPEGLEAGLTPADLRDLIAFLQEAPTLP